MERRLLILNIVISLTLGSVLHHNACAQDYVAPPVSISKDKVKIDGKVFYSHIVLEKQTLFSISKAYNVSIEDIYKYNPAVKENGLRKNDIINIPLVEIHEPVVEETTPVVTEWYPAVTAAEDGETRHTVKWYEDMLTIASKYGVSEEAIMKANGLKDTKLRNKQVLIIPAKTKAAPVEEIIEEVTEVAKVTVEAEEEESSIEQYSDSLGLIDYWTNMIKRNVNATLILPFKATGSSGSRNNMDFYSGVLLAAKELESQDIDLHLNVYDIAAGTSGISSNVLNGSDIIIGPIAPNDITQIIEMTDGGTPVISPLDQRSEKLTTKYRNLVQVPSSQYSQFTDIAAWLKEDSQAEDKVLVISEKEARQNDAGRVLKSVIERSSIQFTPFAYSILEGRNIQPSLEAAMTKTGTNRVVIASESEAFVNDVVRNLNLIVHNKFQVILYAPAKIRTFETIEVENFHNTSLHASLTYNIDYENPDVQNFIRRYRAMFNTEPTQFAYQGYDVTKYFVGLIAKYQNDWMYYLKNEDAEMLQSSFLFRTNGQGGFLNNGIRRIIYGKDYSIEEVL